MSIFWTFWALLARFGPNETFPEKSGSVTFELLCTPKVHQVHTTCMLEHDAKIFNI